MPGQFESILDKLQAKLGKQTVRRASTINRPRPKREVQQIQIFNEFNRRNPRADGGLLNGSSEEAAAAAFRKKVDELMDDGYDFGEAVREAMRQGYQDGGRIGFAEGTPPRKTFIKEYKKFKGSDREFAEYLNKKYKTDKNTTGSVEAKRRRLGIKTVNPKTTGDYKGLEKYIKNFKGKFRPGLFEIANRFGFKDKGVVEKMINRVNPDMKKATPPGRLPP